MWIHSAADVLSLLLKVFSIWFFITALLFWKKPKKYPTKAPRTRFACLIPARNEEAVIADTVQSLLVQRYPRALYDVFVIPNNCTDHTQTAAAAAGAKILNCTHPVRCKGDALRQAMDALQDEGYDAYCVFDADNHVHEGFLGAMNNAFCAGARVAKGALRAKNPYQSPVSGCYALYYGLFDRIFNPSRANLGLSAKLVGTGFAVSREVIEATGGWPTQTIAEVAEFSAICAAMGERVAWVPEAVTYDEAPTAFKTSVTQRMRWSSGIMCAARRRLGSVLAAITGCRPGLAVDSLLFLCAPAAQAISVLPMAERIVESVWNGRTDTLLLTAGLALAVSGGAMLLLASWLALTAGLRDRRILKAVAFFPLFMASWLPIQIVSLIRPARDWKPIRHGACPDWRRSGEEARRLPRLGKSA
jgi:cellulose synthase/poly-beta-1,6-N-acetylglucosamine synthase-like glycosyltransferase